ncbi:MAG TPA: glutathione S-transferase [Gammaproteobacteria bacterium]
MQLFATPRSHFSRKVRLLLDHYELDYELIDIGNVANADEALFQGNPLMQVPVLRDKDLWLIESDHVAAHLVRRCDPDDRYRVLTHDPAVLNMRAVMNGIMADEVKIVLAERTGLDTKPHAFFQKALAGIKNGLQWLDGQAIFFNVGQPGYLEFHLVCLWDHLKIYNLVSLDYPALDSVTRELNTQERITRSAPPAL